jgi:uncharacterized Zn finger protein (UPF0148 family)
MTPPKCPICSTAHYGWQAHTFATNKRLTERLTSTEDATNNATNREASSQSEQRLVVGSPAGSPADNSAHDVGVTRAQIRRGEERTPNRRDRAAYNAYQREYMRRKRGSA